MYKRQHHAEAHGEEHLNLGDIVGGAGDEAGGRELVQLAGGEVCHTAEYITPQIAALSLIHISCVLAGLGLRKLSMSISQVAKVKRALGRHTAVELQRLAEEILACEDADEVLQCMQAALAP